MHTELVILDMAGTTVRDDDAVNRCLQNALTVVGCPANGDEIDSVMGLAKPIAIERLLRRNPSAGEVTAARVQRVHRDFLRRMTHYYGAAPGSSRCHKPRRSCER